MPKYNHWQRCFKSSNKCFLCPDLGHYILKLKTSRVKKDAKKAHLESIVQYSLYEPAFLFQL